MKYNHAFTLAFSIETKKSCKSDSDDDYPSEYELHLAIQKRLNDLKNNPGELLEALGAPFDSFEIEEND